MAERADDEYDQVLCETREAWAAWLEEHHADRRGAWLVTWRAASGRPVLGYEAAVEEALRFGWIDSVGRRLDEDRTMLRFTPRKRGSGWSRPNKERIARLEAEGRMAPAGAAVLAAARADGSWEKLDAVEALEVPPDLAAALDAHLPARAEWDAFPRSVRRAVLEWIASAKRPETRARRVLETAELAQRGERANQWRPKEQR